MSRISPYVILGALTVLALAAMPGASAAQAPVPSSGSPIVDPARCETGYGQEAEVDECAGGPCANTGPVVGAGIVIIVGGHRIEGRVATALVVCGNALIVDDDEADPESEPSVTAYPILSTPVKPPISVGST